MKYVLLGPVLRLLYKPKAVGLESIPEGPAILAANHQSFLDDLLLPLLVPGRKDVFLAKADYFDKWYLRWFFKGANVIPVRLKGSLGRRPALATDGNDVGSLEEPPEVPLVEVIGLGQEHDLPTRHQQWEEEIVQEGLMVGGQDGWTFRDALQAYGLRLVQ